jgi:hypothetical protein
MANAAKGEASDSSPARHTQVVPSIIVPAIGQNIVYSEGIVGSGELVRWERAPDLTESAKQELRALIVRRLRRRPAWIWEQPTDVRLTQDWRDRLSGSDRQGIEAVLQKYPGRPLQELTLDEFRRAFGGGPKQQLAVLARLEALYWTPPARSGQRTRVHVVPKAAGTVPPEPLHVVAERVLALPWLSQVTPDDLRFAYPGSGALPDWLRERLHEELVPSDALVLLQKLDEASRLSAADELRDLTNAAGQECLPPLNKAAWKRWPSMFLARHMAAEGPGKTLQEIGDEHGTTHERVRQICAVYEEFFKRTEAVTPALDRVLSAVAQIETCSAKEANEQFAHLIGEGAGIECLIAWARDVGRAEVKIRCNRVRRTMRGEFVDTTFVERIDASTWVRPLLAHVSRDISMFGCTNIVRVAGWLALKERVAPGQVAIEAVLEGNDFFRWLDKDTGWFTIGAADGGAVAVRVRKIMAVAHDSVGADEICAALTSDDGLIHPNTQSIGHAVPPVHVIRELLRNWSWLKVVQKGRFAPGEGFDSAGALTEHERMAVSLIEKHNGVACRFELGNAAVQELKLSDMAVSIMLGRSPIIRRLEYGLYSLIGRRVGDDALYAARNRLRRNAKESRTARRPDIETNEFLLRVSKTSLKIERYRVPQSLRSQLRGRQVPFRDSVGKPLGQARFNHLAEMRGLNGVFLPKPGDLYRVAVGPDALCVELIASPAGQKAH